MLLHPRIGHDIPAIGMSPSAPSPPAPKSGTKACKVCRKRKIRCDTEKPRCGSCQTHNRICDYTVEPSRKRYAVHLQLAPVHLLTQLNCPNRPSHAIINVLQKENETLTTVLLRLKASDLPEVKSLLDSVTITNAGRVQTPASEPSSASALCLSHGEHDSLPTDVSRTSPQDYEHVDGRCYDEELESAASSPVAGTLAVAQGRSHDYDKTGTVRSAQVNTIEHLRYKLTANAALQLQEEQSLRQTPSLDYIRGVPRELAMHLLDLHWNRQHHTFHLTYRPTFMRELLSGGEYCTDFLLNAVLACSSKYSERTELGAARFFERCEELLAQQSLLSFSSISTTIGLLLLGPSLNAQGLSSKGWLYTGYALRMVYDLELHVDIPTTANNGEEVEIRRRVFWGAFICEKIQSLYLGRPFTLRLRDSNIPCDFMDRFEELEPWRAYSDPLVSNFQSPGSCVCPHTYSITTFQNFCGLATIMGKILDRVYASGARNNLARSDLESTDDSLSTWYRKLPPHLLFEPSSKQDLGSQSVPAPNVLILLTTYHALIILLHRPFILDSNSRGTSIPTHSWRQCSSAAQNITNLVLAYQHTYPLHRANYLLGYALYVACTIHVRNYATADSYHQRINVYSSSLVASMSCLDDLAVPNSGVSNLANIVRRLMNDSGMPTLLGTTLDACSHINFL